MKRALLPLVVALTAGGARAQTVADYDRLKPQIAQRLEANLAAREAWMERALVARGHSGDRSVLMGCDLFNPVLDREHRLLGAVAFSKDASVFAAWLTRQSVEGPPLSLAAYPPMDVDLEGWLAAAHQADQAARARARAHAPPDQDEQTWVQQGMDVSCKLDLAHSAGLQKVAPVLDSLSRTALGHAFILIMHQDHQPALQAEAARTMMAMASSDPSLRFAAARLTDRSLLNIGAPQVYGELFNCDDRRPDGVPPDLIALDERRMALGLPSFAETVERSCP